MLVLTFMSVRKDVDVDSARVAIESIVSQMKVSTEEILVWGSSPDKRSLWRLSRLEDVHLLYEYQLMYEGVVDFVFTPLLDVHDAFRSVVHDWSAQAEDPESGDLAW